MPARMEKIKYIAELDELVDFIGLSSGQRINLFVGSFISCAPPSKASSVAEIREKIAYELLDSLQGNPDLIDNIRRELLQTMVGNRYKVIPFESLWERIARVTDTAFVCMKLQHLLSSGSPNYNHKAIARLVKSRYIDTIFTTNYDEYIEQAFYNSTDRCSYNTLNPQEPAVYHNFDVYSSQVTLIKLHGTFSIPSSLAFMFPQLTNAFSNSSYSRYRRILFKSPIIFCGYGFNDWDLRFLYSLTGGQRFVIVRPPNGKTEGVPPRIKKIAQSEAARLYKDDLMNDNNVLCKLFNDSEMTEDNDSEMTEDISKAMFSGLDDGKKIEILGEILESLSLPVAKDVFTLAIEANKKKLMPSTYLELKALLSSRHGGDFSYVFQKGKEIFEESDLTSYDKAWIWTEMFFSASMRRDSFGSHKSIVEIVRYAFTTLLWLLWLLPRAVYMLRVNKWNDTQRRNAEKFSYILQIMSHNLIRIPLAILNRISNVFIIGHLVRLVSIVPLITLLLNRAFLKRIGSLDSYAHQNREEGHAFLLLGFNKLARNHIEEAIQAYDWGQWHQMKVNGLRSLGWVNLRERRDQEARSNFGEVERLSKEYRRPDGTMTLDRVKGLLELKRLNKLKNVEDNKTDKYLMEAIRDYVYKAKKGTEKDIKDIWQMAQNLPKNRWPLTIRL